MQLIVNKLKKICYDYNREYGDGMRMDKYSDSTVDSTNEVPVLSRQAKNKDMYNEIYMNSSYVDINSVLENEEKKETPIIEDAPVEIIEEEKSYDVNDFLKKAHEKYQEDDAMRNLDDKKFIEREDEIRKLIADIDDKDIDFFSDLRGDNEDTLIEGKLGTDEFDESIYLSLIEQEIRKKEENTILNNALGEDTVLNMKKIEEEKLDHTFEKIVESDRKVTRKFKKLPVIVFSVTLFILLCIIIIIVLK